MWPDPRLGPELAFDDDPSTRWGGAPDSRDGWLAIELAEPKTFIRVRISEAYDRIQEFEIQVQQDGQWRTILLYGTMLPEKIDRVTGNGRGWQLG